MENLISKLLIKTTMSEHPEPKRQKTVPCVGYDVTIPMKNGLTVEDVKDWANQYFKKWVFQKEMGRSGYEHFQFRGWLIKKRREGEVIKLLAPQWPCYAEGLDISVTTSGVHHGSDFNYVMKKDTRIDGPYKDDDPTKPPLTRQLIEFEKLIRTPLNLEGYPGMYPWQKKAMKLVEEEDNFRTIHMVYDRDVGNMGKSVFCEWLEYKGLAFEVPPLTSAEDLAQFVFDFPISRCYLIDLPKAMPKAKLAGLYAGIEQLKNGKVYNKRYKGQKKSFDRPNVIVFSNQMPKLEWLSADRWNIHTITDEKDFQN